MQETESDESNLKDTRRNLEMADEPARALIVYGDGLMRYLAPHHSHIHSVAAAGTCGFLALRCQPSSGDDTKRMVGELAQLLDIHDIYQRTGVTKDVTSDSSIAEDGPIPSMSERFMGMKSGMFSNTGPAADLAKKAGFSILEMEAGNIVSEDTILPKPSVTASQLLNLLGLRNSIVNTEQSNFELLLVHLSTVQEGQTGSQLVDWLDELLGELQLLAQPGTKAASLLYLVVVLGYGSIELCSIEDDDLSLVVSDGLVPALAQLVPQQSYKWKGGHPVDDVRDHHPLLVAYNLSGMTRRDESKIFDHLEFQKCGGNLAILVDQFLYEVAFKLWKAPKYGA